MTKLTQKSSALTGDHGLGRGAPFSVSREILLFLTLTLLSIFVLIRFVNLTPQLDQNIFFSSADPQFQSEAKIVEVFGSAGSELIISAAGDIVTPEYSKNIKALTEKFLTIDGVNSVISLTSGPVNLDAALNGPMWRRIIISKDRKSTLMLVMLDLAKVKKIVPQVEKIIADKSRDEFKLAVSGFPYIAELITRKLTRDLILFTSLAFIIFGIMTFIIFRSFPILFGVYLVCGNACIFTLIILSMINIPIGLISCNIPVIVFVMALSHIIFLTFNWRSAIKKGSGVPVKDAVKITFPASFWSMVTTLLGFISLTSVPAKPLRDFGTSGTVGCLVAIAVVYGIFPAFLRSIKNFQVGKDGFLKTEEKVATIFENNQKTILFSVVLICLISIPGLWKLNLDPSLLSYFKKKSAVYQGLQYIDRNGGSSPLIMVVQNKDNSRLTEKKSLRKLKDLQRAFEENAAVGRVVSFYTLLGQARTVRFSRILPTEKLVQFMEGPGLDSVAKGFITPDRKFSLYLLRMYEEGRTKPRLRIVEELKELIDSRGLSTTIIGGVYLLQGHLSSLVTSSLILGIGKLLLIFTGIIIFLSRSLRIAAATAFGIALIPMTILGFAGLYGVPLDIISAPASNVAIGLGIDSMIHMINSYRRRKKTGESCSWREIKNELYYPVLTSLLVVAVGFFIFLLSVFPPLQRFGASIVYGAIFAGFIALYIIPFLSELKIKRIHTKGRG